MRQFLCLLLFGLSLHAAARSAVKTDTLSFIFEGKKLAGILSLPDTGRPRGLVLLIPGSGKTTMVEGNGYYRRTSRFFVEQGFACYVWDKPGCEPSEGVFDDLNFQSSAAEGIAAIEALQHRNIPGSDRIGLWSLSRGGYVCPLIIARHGSIAFWISVSGPDGEETFGYLLERNFLIEGRSKAETAALMKSWRGNLDVARHGGTWAENQKATRLLRADPFYKALTENDPPPTEEGYLKWQQSFMEGTNPFPVNEATGLQVYVPQFGDVLGKVNCPVLAVFGEKDSQVDWQKTLALYKKRIGQRPGASLSVRTFPDGNHNLFKCKTGGLRERLDKYEFCEGYFDVMAAWLAEQG